MRRVLSEPAFYLVGIAIVVVVVVLLFLFNVQTGTTHN